MSGSSIRSDAMSWQTVDKKLDVRTVSNESLSHTLIKRGKKIKKRTKLLNRELKKFAALKSYSQYVRVKTAILRAISDNDDTDDDELPSPPLSSMLSLNNSNEESSFDIFSESLPLLTDEPTILPSRKIKSAQTRRKDKNSKQSNLSRKNTRLKNNKMFVGGEKFRDNIDDTHSGEQGGKNEKNIRKLRGCSGARRNLTSLLESLDDPTTPIREVQSTEIVASGNSDDADNNGNNKNNNSNNVNHNNRKSQSDEIKNSRQIVQMTNQQPGDSGIDDDSQDNLSINNRAKDIIIHDEQKRDNHQDLELRNEASSSRVDEDDVQMVVDVHEDQISEIRAEKEQQQPIVTDEMRPKKSQPTITCTELVKSKYMIIRDENEEEKRRERNDFFQGSSSNHQIIHDEEIMEENIDEVTQDNIEEITEENIEEITQENAEENIEEITQENAEENIEESAEENIEEITEENIEEITQDNIEEMTQENTEEIIAENNEIIIEMDRISPETRRVSQMKRINLICSSTESDSSQDDEIFVKRASHSQGRIEMFGSQVISDPSDSDESVESIEMSQHIDTVHSGSLPVSSLPFEISNTTTNCIQHDNTPIIKSVKKSIKSQIEEQETDDDNSPIVERKKKNKLEETLDVAQVVAAMTPSSSSSSRRSSISETINEQMEAPEENLAEYHDNIITKKKERSIVSSTIRPMPTEAESLRYVLNNLCTRSNNKVDPLLSPDGLFNNNNDNNNDNTRDENGSERDQLPDETLSSRPIELTDFVTRQGLVPTRELSTITINDVINCAEHDEDDEIWLMEIPRMIANDPQLCGKSISLEKESMIIGETRYGIIRRHEKSVSCILRTGSKKKARYKTVNVRPVGSIVIRHESTEKCTSGVSNKKQHRKTNMAAIADAGKIVPFPKNLKSRDPLMAQQQNFADDDKNMASPSNKTRRKSKTQRCKIWHVDNFIIKSKRKKDFP